MLKKKWKNLAIILDKNINYSTIEFSSNLKYLKYNKKYFIIKKSNSFILTGYNPFISFLKNLMRFPYFVYIFNTSENIKQLKNKTYISPISFTEELQAQEYSKITPLLLRTFAEQKGYTLFYKSLIKQARKASTWVKYLIVGSVVVIVTFLIFIFFMGGG